MNSGNCKLNNYIFMCQIFDYLSVLNVWWLVLLIVLCSGQLVPGIKQELIVIAIMLATWLLQQ